MSANDAELEAVIGSKYASLYEASRPVYDEMGKLTGGYELKLIYYQQIMPTGWYSMTPVKFVPVQSEDKRVTYNMPSDSYDTLMYCYKTAELPFLKIKEEYAETYRFRWDDDIGYKISPSSELNYNGIRIQHKDTMFDIIMSELYIEPGHIHQHKIDVGNTKDIIGWATEHPAKMIQPMESWSYSKKAETALHIYKLDSLTKLTHKYTYDLDIENLICMQKFEDDKWVDIKPVMNIFVANVPKLETPKLYGIFGNIKDEEKLFHNTYDLYYIDDMGVCDCKNDVKNGTVADVTIKSKAVIKAIHWGAQNMKAFHMNNKCNYTNNSSNHKLGSNPIINNTLSYVAGGEIKFKELESNHFEGPLVRKHFISASRRRGINSYAYTYRPGDVGIDPGLVASAKLECKIASPSCDDSYLLQCRLLVMREMTIRGGKIYFDLESTSTHAKSSSPSLAL